MKTEQKNDEAKTKDEALDIAQTRGHEDQTTFRARSRN